MGDLTAGPCTLSRPDAPHLEAGGAVCRAAYDIATGEGHVVHIVVRGIWTMAVLADFARDAAAAVRAHGRAPAARRLLCDINQAAIQPQPVYAALLAMLIAARGGRTALVSTNPLSRMQARRLMAACPGIALFEDETAARRWLDA